METDSVPDYPRGITFEQVWAAIHADRKALQASSEEFDRRMREWDERLKKEKEAREAHEAREALEKKEREAREARENKKREAREALEKKEREAREALEKKEREAREARERKEWEAREALEKKEQAKRDKEFNRRFGDFTDRIGQIMECLVEPKLYKRFQALGIHVNRTCRRIEFEGEEGRVFEIDVLLENDDTSIAVEVKTKVAFEDVDRHMKRMEKLRIYEDNRKSSIKRIYYGAMAGAVFEKEVRDYALKCGFFAIVPSGNTFDVIFPEGEFKPRIW